MLKIYIKKIIHIIICLMLLAIKSALLLWVLQIQFLYKHVIYTSIKLVTLKRK